MRAFTVLSTLVAVAVSGVLATPDAPATLIARQSSALPNVPDSCKSACATVQTMTDCGADLACVCSTKMGQGLVDCGNCGLDYGKSDPNISTYRSQFESAIKAYQDSCAQAGHPVGQLSLGSSNAKSGSGSSGGSGNGAASTRAMSGAGALVGVAVVMAMI